MTTALGYLFLLLPVVAIAWIVWSYRRKAGDKEARSREREASLVGLVQAVDRAPRPVAAERTGASPAAPVPAAPVPLAATRRERFLTQPETLTYYLLRAGMPGYEVFPRVSLASLVAGARPVRGRTIDQSSSSTHDLDFVVCDKSLRIVAAIQLEGRLTGPDSAWIEQNLTAAGIKLVKVDTAALPRREQLGALILGLGG